MKHKGCRCDFIPQRNRELLQAYRRVCGSRKFIIRHDVYTEVADSPCSRFWVSEERARAVVSSLLKGHYALDSMLPQKREMFIEIFKRTTVICKENPDMPFSDAVFFAVNSPAPKFYMTPKSIIETISKIRRGFYKTHNFHHAH